MSDPITLVYGYHAVLSLIQSQPKRLKTVYRLKDRDDRRMELLLQALAPLDVPVHELSRAELENRLAQSGHREVNHQGVVAECTQATELSEAYLDELFNGLKSDQTLRLLCLDSVQDPHNLGACLRSANAFGVDAVIAPKKNAVGITPVVRKVACGAAELTPFIRVTNLVRTIKYCQQQGVWFVAMDAGADQSFSDLGNEGHVGLVMGAEGKGLRRLTLETCDFSAKIPMCGSMESLNVSVATGIALYEIAK